MDYDISRFDIIDGNKLKGYERVDPKNVLSVLNSIQFTGVIRCPVICDREKKIIIDGHHRVIALYLAGITNIPVYHFDYESRDIKVGNWYRNIINAEPNRLISFIEKLSILELKYKSLQSFNLVVEADCGIEYKRTVKSPSVAAESLFWACENALFEGNNIKLNAIKTSFSNGSNVSTVYIDPPIGKKSVLRAIQTDYLFPYQTNRHIIYYRPVNMKLPIKVLTLDINKAKLALVRHIQKQNYELVHDSSTYDGRYYEEPLVRFK